MLRRPRRNRRTKVIRELVQETNIHLNQLIYPIFVVDGMKKKEMIDSMPGIYRFSIDNALEEIEECIRLGIQSFILFPVISNELKDTKASYSHSKNNFYLKAIHRIKAIYPDICIITDVAMDPYSSDGHDGLVQRGEVLNDETLPILAKMAVAQAEAGADIIGPSDMMDGRISYLRNKLDSEGHSKVALMSYTAKYASSFYAPFRNALDSAPKSGDKKTYQMQYTNQKEALLEAELDYKEGADHLMVKPALSYLDVISLLKDHFLIPIVAFNVSGEYSMLKAAVNNGWLDNENCITEVLYSIKRAGADMIITYFAKEYAKLIG